MKRKSLTHTFNDPLQRAAAAPRPLEAYFFTHVVRLSERSFDLPFPRRPPARCTRRSRRLGADPLAACAFAAATAVGAFSLPSFPVRPSLSSSFPAPSSRDPATKNLLQANSCLLLRNVISARRVTQKEIDYGGTLINCRVIQKLRILSFLLLQPGPCSVPLSIGLSLAVSPVPIAGDSRHLLSIYNLWHGRAGRPLDSVEIYYSDTQMKGGEKSSFRTAAMHAVSLLSLLLLPWLSRPFP